MSYSLAKALLGFHQYIDYPTGDSKIPALLFASAEDANGVTAPLPPGRSDYNLILLTPEYVPLFQRQPGCGGEKGTEQTAIHHG